MVVWERFVWGEVWESEWIEGGGRRLAADGKARYFVGFSTDLDQAGFVPHHFASTTNRGVAIQIGDGFGGSANQSCQIEEDDGP